jgi:hypothetical protein
MPQLGLHHSNQVLVAILRLVLELRQILSLHAATHLLTPAIQHQEISGTCLMVSALLHPRATDLGRYQMKRAGLQQIPDVALVPPPI